MKHLIVNVDLPHLRLHPFSHFLFQTLVFIVTLLSHFSYPCGLYEIWKLEGHLMNSSFVLKVSSFLIPMSWNWHRVSNHLHVHEKDWVISSDVPCLNKIWALDFHFQVKDLHSL